MRGREVQMAHTEDIIIALYKIDVTNQMSRTIKSLYSLGTIPVSSEELNVIFRPNQLEQRIS